MHQSDGQGLSLPCAAVVSHSTSGKLKVCLGSAQGSCVHVMGGNSDGRNNLYLSLVDISL